MFSAVRPLVTARTCDEVALDVYRVRVGVVIATAGIGVAARSTVTAFSETEAGDDAALRHIVRIDT